MQGILEPVIRNGLEAESSLTGTKSSVSAGAHVVVFEVVPAVKIVAVKE